MQAAALRIGNLLNHTELGRDIKLPAMTVHRISICSRPASGKPYIRHSLSPASPALSNRRIPAAMEYGQDDDTACLRRKVHAKREIAWQRHGMRVSAESLTSLQGTIPLFRDATSWVFACLWRCVQNTAMKFLDPDTESAVRVFLARLPADLRLEYAILYGSRARGEDRPDSDADLALIIAEGAGDWQLVGSLAELAYDVFLESGILIQPVPISLRHWLNPERFPRPGFLRNVARDGIVL
jgi:predicted nucleotidyltransferase